MGNGCMRQKSVDVALPSLPTFKIVVVGDTRSGKTSVVRRFIENLFDGEYKQTVDVNISSVVKKLNVPDQVIVSVEIWDTPGQNDVDLRKTYYLDVDAVIVVTDISNEMSMNLAGSWSLDVANHARVTRTFTEAVPNSGGKTIKKTSRGFAPAKPGTIPMLLLGNRYDMAKEKFRKNLELSLHNGVVPQSVGNGFLKLPTEVKKQEPILGNGDVIMHDDVSEMAEKADDVIGKPDDVTKESADIPDDVIEKSDDTKPTDEVQGQQEEEKVEGEEKDNQDVVHSNGDVTNHLMTNGKVMPEKKYKKIFPKDETVNGIIVNEHDDLKSTITNMTSVSSMLPPCVEDIEKMAEQYNFIAGVPVSAKTPDGGVQEAIQSLLRHLVAKKLFPKKERETVVGREQKQNLDVASTTRSIRSSMSKVSKQRKIGFTPLLEVGIIEIDELIRRCNITLQDAEELTGGFAEAVHRLKMISFKMGITAGTRVAVEVCVSSLKQIVSSSKFDPVMSEDRRENVKLFLMKQEKQNSVMTLISEDNDGFPDLRVVDGNRDDIEKYKETNYRLQIPSKISKILTEYREKFLVRSIAVTSQGDLVEETLIKQTGELAEKEEKAWETAVAAGLSPAQVRGILSTLAQNKARLRGTVEHLQETKQTVQEMASKIRAVLLT